MDNQPQSSQHEPIKADSSAPKKGGPGRSGRLKENHANTIARITMTTERRRLISAAFTALLFAGHSLGAAGQTTLKDAYRDDFLVGAALNDSQFEETDARGAALAKRQFNAVSPENALKWQRLHPKPGVYDFTDADRYVEFGLKNGMFIVGHNLVWHGATPKWVFEDAKGNPIDRNTLLARMRDHILTVVGRYKGKIGGWDVVNEALSYDGTLTKTSWEKIIGDDYVLKAYQFAHEADPQAQLYYNEFFYYHEFSRISVAKRNAAIELVRRLQAQGVHIAGVGMQGHYGLNAPTTKEVDETITEISKLGVRVMITEMDIDMLPPVKEVEFSKQPMHIPLNSEIDPYMSGLPDSVQQELALRYADLFTVFLRHRDVIQRVTFWGLTDASSWLNDFPVYGRTSYPLLFDRSYQPKPAYDAVIEVARRASAN
jgi:endo-1,4-beta-xylanase